MNKTAIIKLRVTPEEKAAFEVAAQATGKTLSAILRDAVLQEIERPPEQIGGDA